MINVIYRSFTLGPINPVPQWRTGMATYMRGLSVAVELTSMLKEDDTLEIRVYEADEYESEKEDCPDVDKTPIMKYGVVNVMSLINQTEDEIDSILIMGDDPHHTKILSFDVTGDPPIILNEEKKYWACLHFNGHDESILPRGEKTFIPLVGLTNLN